MCPFLGSIQNRLGGWTVQLILFKLEAIPSYSGSNFFIRWNDTFAFNPEIPTASYEKMK